MNKQILFRHFQETQHTYAMQIGNSRVWDYVGDNFVHRLVQSKGDGKLVAVEDQQSSEMDGKADSLSLEVLFEISLTGILIQEVYQRELIGISLGYL